MRAAVPPDAAAALARGLGDGSETGLGAELVRALEALAAADQGTQRANFIRHRRGRPEAMPVAAREVGDHEGVARIGLAARRPGAGTGGRRHWPSQQALGLPHAIRKSRTAPDNTKVLQ